MPAYDDDDVQRFLNSLVVSPTGTALLILNHRYYRCNMLWHINEGENEHD